MTTPWPAWRLARAVALLLLGAVLAACASGSVPPGGVVSWRELTIDLPDDWVVISQNETSLYVADGLGATEPGVRGDQEVGTQFAIQPNTTPEHLRRFVQDENGELEMDTRTTVGGVPATLIQYTFTTNDVPLRERVLLIPSRNLVILQQPTPTQGETEGPEWFNEHLEELDALLESIRFGAPEGFLED